MKKEKQTHWGLMLTIAIVALAVNSNRRACLLCVVARIARKAVRRHIRRELGGPALRHVDEAELAVIERFAVFPVNFRYRSEPEAKSFWCRCVKHEVINLLRKDKDVALPDGQDVADTRSPSALKDLIFDVREAIKKLPWPHCACVELKNLNGFGFAEVADMVALPTTTAWMRHGEALEHLRILLRAYAS